MSLNVSLNNQVEEPGRSDNAGYLPGSGLYMLAGRRSFGSTRNGTLTLSMPGASATSISSTPRFVPICLLAKTTKPYSQPTPFIGLGLKFQPETRKTTEYSRFLCSKERVKTQ